jgi:hypothetical protein
MRERSKSKIRAPNLAWTGAHAGAWVGAQVKVRAVKQTRAKWHEEQLLIHTINKE